MKKNNLISITAIILALVAFLTSCGGIFSKPSIYPEGYTGGVGIPYGSGLQVAWVETYDEAINAIDLLKSHESTFRELVLLHFDEAVYDVKYCFVFNEEYDRIRFGESHFDRYAKLVDVVCYVFFEEVTIEQLSYSYVDDYASVKLEKRLFDLDKNESYKEVDFSKVTWEIHSSSDYYLGQYEGTEILRLQIYSKDKVADLDISFSEIVSSIELVD